MDTAAAVSLAGMDPMHYLTTTDDVERSMMEGIASRVRELQIRRDRNLAVEIANNVRRSFGS